MAPDSGEPTSVLDASALLALLQDERGADAVVEAVAEGAAISTVNFAEVLSKLAGVGKVPADGAREIHEAAGAAGVLAVEPFTEADSQEAARLAPLTRRLGLSLGDRSCLALASRLGVPAVTADGPWTAAEVDVTVRVIR